MSYVWSVAIDEILGCGCWLGNFGVKNWALDRHAVLDALSQFECAGIAALGGDVYVQQGENIQPSYDNWYCERTSSETFLAFLSRSIEMAREYVVTYSSNRSNVLFVLVPQGAQARNSP
jgi:hypothetical protein